MDTDQTPQRFPLQKLLRAIIRVTGTKAATCRIRQVSGYGIQVNTLREQLDVAEFVDISMVDLDLLAAGIDEWFYHVEAELPDELIRFGLHDSTAMFVEGEQKLVDSVVASFTDCRSEMPAIQ